MTPTRKATGIFIAAIVVMSVLALSITPVSAANTYYVNPGGKIQDKINAASDGDTIIVRDGTYKENVVVNKSLTIRSEHGAAFTTVEANDTNDHVFWVINDSVNISGFTVKNATGWNSGIYLNDVDHCTISDNIALKNGFGIHLISSHNNTIRGNVASYNNYKGIYLQDSDYNDITDNTVTSNNEDGIFLENSEHCKVINNVVTGHTRGPFSFDILLLNGTKLEYQGELRFSNYETARLPLKHAAGPLTIRVSQHGHDAAYLDYVALTMGDTLYQPTAAVDLETGACVLRKILIPEYDVCYAWNRTIELTWEAVPADTTLIMRAMEEDLGEEHGSPLYYPLLREGHTLTYTIGDDGGIPVDGILEEPAEPDFTVFWKPESPHPEGYTYGWLHADDHYVYAAVEITADNTPDKEDWGALFVMVDGELREFRVSCNDREWGAIGFQYTASVPYEHRIYEFQIPLTELDAQVGDELHYGFGAYGTVFAFYAGITSVQSSNNLILKNKVSGNSYGVYFHEAQWETIKENEITDNGHGIWVGASNNNIIERNMIARNSLLVDTGVHIDANSDNNSIHGNCFFYNVPYQAVDDFPGFSNHWNGNYWEPPPGEPDEPFLIRGYAQSSDNNPLQYCPLCAVEVPALSPTGLIALASLLSAIAAVAIVRKRR
jgi:parallel beta-helix repeat protein